MGQNKLWEYPQCAIQFASKTADHRLKELCNQYPNPGGVRVLDLGCAGGRNTLFLANGGFNVWAVDSSKAMIEQTKNQLKAIWPSCKINERIIPGSMENFDWAKSGFFDLIVALGIYHNATSMNMMKKAVSESARILKKDGRLLVANFAPGTQLENFNLVKNESMDWLWTDKKKGILCLLTGDELDLLMNNTSLFPVSKTQTVIKQLENAKRVTVNALYKKGL
jgi:SAM-dependent methyltransferase